MHVASARKARGQADAPDDVRATDRPSSALRYGRAPGTDVWRGEIEVAYPASAGELVPDGARVTSRRTGTNGLPEGLADDIGFGAFGEGSDDGVAGVARSRADIQTASAIRAGS